MHFSSGIWNRDLKFRAVEVCTYVEPHSCSLCQRMTRLARTYQPKPDSRKRFFSDHIITNQYYRFVHIIGIRKIPRIRLSRIWWLTTIDLFDLASLFYEPAKFKKLPVLCSVWSPHICVLGRRRWFADCFLSWWSIFSPPRAVRCKYFVTSFPEYLRATLSLSQEVGSV